MKNKEAKTIILLIVTVIGSMFLNFQEFLMGSPATVKNLIVTFAYITIWILVLATSTKSNNRGIPTYYYVFWLLTLFLAILTGYVNVTGAQVDWALPLAILLLGQWYGIDFLTGSFLSTSIITAFISLVMLIAAVVSFKRTKSVL